MKIEFFFKPYPQMCVVVFEREDDFWAIGEKSSFCSPITISRTESEKANCLETVVCAAQWTQQAIVFFKWTLNAHL